MNFSFQQDILSTVFFRGIYLMEWFIIIIWEEKYLKIPLSLCYVIVMTLQISQSHRYGMEASLQSPEFFLQMADILHVPTGFQIRLV